jgi:hypothetical protein
MSSDDFTREPLGIGPRLKELDRQLKAADREALGNISAGLAQAISERDAARAENARLRECLEGMVWQFGHPFERDGEHYLGTMGLSNLEDAFEVLGWDDPHPYDPDEGLVGHER